ncbi:MAG: hypothetical protein M3M88_04110 [Thermoproteota archaeon]|nr:hypothetical protein [Thermoproteota archaeon]
MSNITKNHKVGIFAIFIASALMLGTISVSGFDTALGKNSNSAGQSIKQTQVGNQESQCVDDGLVTVPIEDCNNVVAQLQENSEGNTAGQK